MSNGDLLKEIGARISMARKAVKQGGRGEPQGLVTAETGICYAGKASFAA